ncbi:MFS transporter [Nocardioides sp. CER19]|uniref:MFS transporter n=1 Tax=Nocardioides sp. CER19 TaxID=3038538 RepID=UPI00244B8CCC|nr:MFS transporter [Nocardioides sp. CER19]MDH2415386.1 MFS transporter [Nocardioides sp. CER19]
MTTTTATPPSLLTTRTSVALSFALNGLLFATLVSRYPDVRSDLDLSNSALGLLLISGSIGSVLSLPLSGRIIERFKPAATVRGGSLAVGSGLMLTGVGATVVQQAWLAVVGLFVYGIGTSIWDVAMNVEGAEVERRLGRTIMPRFHAAWSVGSIAGSGVGVLMAALGVPVVLHYLLIGVVAVVLAIRTAGTFLPVEERHVEERPRASVWREPRTLVIGLMVLCYATVEGTANDWLSLAVIDGYHQPHWVGIAGFSVFVVSMTAGRLAGPLLLDRFGRAPVLWACSVAAAVGVLVTVFGGSLPVMFVGVVVWGIGASLGFPVGMSAAADDPVRAAARVSAVATIGYAAFLAGPPLLGLLGDAVGTLRALVVVAVLMVPASLTVFAARPRPVSASTD